MCVVHRPQFCLVDMRGLLLRSPLGSVMNGGREEETNERTNEEFVFFSKFHEIKSKYFGKHVLIEMILRGEYWDSVLEID